MPSCDSRCRYRFSGLPYGEGGRPCNIPEQNRHLMLVGMAYPEGIARIQPAQRKVGLLEAYRLTGPGNSSIDFIPVRLLIRPE
jgi:hypothetical protein